MRRRRALAIGLGAMGVAAASAQGCSLGLDPSLIGADAGDASIPPGDDGPVTPPIDGSGDAKPAGDAATCVIDKDCVSPNACRVGRCAGGKCVFDVCPVKGEAGLATCSASSCVNGACSAPTTFGFHSASVHVGEGPVGCGGDPNRCLAAAYPFVFVGTANGVVAYSVVDPSNPTPPAVPITGLPFLPTSIVANGSRVYFVGSLVGAGPTYKLAVAWIDVPLDPLATSLTATSVFDSYTEPQLNLALAAPGQGLYFVDSDPAHFFPTAVLAPPLKDGDTLTFNPSPGVPTDAYPVVASGSRIVDVRWANDSGQYDTWFSLETAAATPNAQNAGEQNVFASMGSTTPQATFAHGGDGSVLWNTGSAYLDDAGTPLIRAARFAWVLADGNATTFDATAHVDIEPYVPAVAYGTTVAGPIAWVDASTALVLAAAANQQAQTSVQVVVKTPSPALAQGRRFVVSVGIGTVGAASSGGFGYVLANDAPDSCSLHIFAPACAQ